MSEAVKEHPKWNEPLILVASIAVGILGTIIGLELLTRVGITPNTSVIGAILAILVSRIPLAALRKLRDIHRQNLLQTVISAATFGGANGILLPIGIPWLLGRPDLVIPMFIGATIAVIVDMTTIYWIFDTKLYAARNPWPPGIATAEAIKAAAAGGKRAMLLVYGGIAAFVLTYFKVPMDVVGISWIANVVAIVMFGIGLILRGYSIQLFGLDINKFYVPHGIMIGAGIAALLQVYFIVRPKRKAATTEEAYAYTRTDRDLTFGLGKGFGIYVVVALALAALAGLYSEMPPAMFIAWFVFAAVGAIVTAIICGLSAMHAGWFPAFATALIFLVLAMIAGFPPAASALFVGYVAATGPAFADLGYDLKTGWLLRGEGKDPEFEKEGRRQQYFAELLGIVIGAAFVLGLYRTYFGLNLFPPVDRVYVATIKAGVDPTVLNWILIWTVPGFIVQIVGGPARQVGILFATGLLIVNPIAGITCLVAVAIRLALFKIYGTKLQDPMYVAAAGFIAGSALSSFTTATMAAAVQKR